ncbi:putative secreted protein (Por secretion system target) [Flavobacteriaceae bacterium MAR_2010_105]|nr:putative secreted protein (Por secretion system target) [Flavobacteriaceae bacterium MAR_2010_105]
MRNFTFLFILILTTTSSLAQDLVMTVSVPPGTTSCRFSGAFWGWDPNGGPVGVDNGNDTFTFTLSPAPSADMEYLFTINGSGTYENLIDNAQNAECTDRVNSGNFNTDYSTYANRIWKTSDALTWNEVYDSCQQATLSINDTNKFDFIVYPNPARDSWKFKANTTISKIQLFDMLGKQVSSLSPNALEVKIDASLMPSGLYFAKIDSAYGFQNIKLIKK